MLRYKTIVLALFSLLAYSASCMSSGLPEEHEAVRLMLALESSVEAKNWQESEAQLVALQRLSVELPEEFYYFRALSLKAKDDFVHAQKDLESYVVNAGADGKYYLDALKQITDIERLLQSETYTQTQGADTRSPAVIEGEHDGYISSLKALYLTDSAVDALLQQINSLLALHHYTGSRLRKQDAKEGVIFNVAVDLSDSELLVQKKSYEGERPLLSVEKLTVLGMNPFLEYACDAQAYACWIYHPGQANERWVVIEADQLVVADLAMAIGKLIRQLQGKG